MSGHLVPPFDAKALRARIEAVLGPEAHVLEIAFRPMFGGITGYAFGRNFASLSDVGLAIKLGATDRAALLAAGGRPLQYEPGGPVSRSSVVVPDVVLNDDAALRAWLHTSIAFCRAAPAKAARSRRAKS
jgi:TfoX/Sxy family transcriptional regulator of competence genes